MADFWGGIRDRFYDEALGFGDAALSLGSGMAAEPVAGWAGILSGFDPYAVGTTKDALTWTPRTEAGRSNLGRLAGAVESAMSFKPLLRDQTLGEEMQGYGDFWRESAVPWLQENLGEGLGAGVAATGIGALNAGLPGGSRGGRLLALPSPSAKRTANRVTREENWQALERASHNAGTKRSPTTGRYVGGPGDVRSPQKRSAIVQKYDERTQNAIDAGIPPGYFYQQGRDALARITDNPAEHRNLALLYGPTSTQVGPYENTMYAIRAMDQQAMGVPSNVTLYPNNLRPTVDAVMYGEDPWKGYKVDRYSELLGPENTRSNPLQRMPPNDQWEGYGTGFKRGQVPSGATQVAWSDDVRRRAMDRINMRRAEAGQDPLSAEEVQELHWAAIRAETEGRPLELTDRDTVQGSLPYFSVQHGWEAEPGGTSGIGRITSKEDYANQVAGTVIDEAGKDRFIRAMGGRLQEPVVRGTGVWEGDLSPGFQSRSFASHTQGGGLDPAGRARLDSTEAVRQYMLGQEGRAYSLLQRTGAKGQRNIADVDTGSIPSPEETARLQAALGDRGIVMPREGGYRAISTGDIGPIGVTPQGEAIMAPDFERLVSEMPGEATFGRNLGEYASMDWEGRRATEDLLSVLDNPSAPGAARLADSPQTRQLAGDIADLYRRLGAEGKLTQNQSLTRALETWRDQGLDGLRELVKQGLAPAALLGVFAAGGQTPDQSES